MSNRLDSAIKVRTDSGGGSLYQKEAKIYPRDVRGTFATLRRWSMLVLLGLFYSVLWLRWDDRQAVLFDLPARKFYVWGLTFWPQDFIYLAILLLILALCLFFFTALAGRLWCGFACPQTVWTMAFTTIERWTEGDRHQRMKLDKAPWTFNKLWRKTTKQLLWLGLALWTGLTFVGYFMPIHDLLRGFVQLDLHPWAWFWVLFYGLATYGNAGFLREQVCKYMCPYARFQSAMFDKDTLIISYDEARGEPRGGRKRQADPKALGLGDCINCTLCVQVCPTGIDIRDGLQYECIACAACIDVCDQVMDKMDYPRGLIRYTTEHALHGEKIRTVRPRMLVYAALLGVIISGLVVSITTRQPLRLEVMRDRNALYRELADSRVENVYTIRVINMLEKPRDYTLEVTGLERIEVDYPDISVPGGQTAAFPLRVRADRAAGRGSVPIQLTIRSVDEPERSVVRDSKFFLPVENP